jgi:hypothetical protein
VYSSRIHATTGPVLSDLDVESVLSTWEIISQILNTSHSVVELLLQGAVIDGVQNADVPSASFDQFVEFPDLMSVDEVFRKIGLDLEMMRIPNTPAVSEIRLCHDSRQYQVCDAELPGSSGRSDSVTLSCCLLRPLAGSGQQRYLDLSLGFVQSIFVRPNWDYSQRTFWMRSTCVWCWWVHFLSG